MKNRHKAAVALVASLALVGSWFVIPGFQVAGYDVLLQYGPVSWRPWTIRKLEALGEPGFTPLVYALQDQSDVGRSKVGSFAQAALQRLAPESLPAVMAAADKPNSILRYRCAEIFLRAIQDVRDADKPRNTSIFGAIDSEEPVEAISEARAAPFTPYLPDLRRRLADPNPKVRTIHLEILLHMPEGISRSIPAVLLAIRDPSFPLQDQARRALTGIPPGGCPGILKTLDALLQDLAKDPPPKDKIGPDFVTTTEYTRGMGSGETISDGPVEHRFRAARWILAYLDEEPTADAVPVLVRALSNQEQLRDQAAVTLGKLEGDPTVSAELLPSPNPDARLMGLRLFDDREPKKANHASILACLDDSNKDARLLAIAICRRTPSLHSAAQVTLLKIAAKAPDPEGLAAIKALAAIRPSPADFLALLGRSFGEGNLAMRRLAAGYFVQLGPQSRGSIPALEAALEDPDKVVRDRALDALIAIGEPAVPHLIVMLRGPDPKLRALAATALGGQGQGGEDAVSALLQACADKEASVREQALWALCEIAPKDPRVRAALQAALKDPSEEIRVFAQDALESDR